ncbi:MAG: hypothetical protein E6274_14915, partial [Clostridium sp.]
MEGIINQTTDEQMRWGYNYSGSWSSDKDVIRREEYNSSQIESINHIVEKYVNKLICYSAGYLGGTFLGTKGLDKITKGVKGLISGTETGTIKTLEQGATQALKSIKDI